MEALLDTKHHLLNGWRMKVIRVFGTSEAPVEEIDGKCSWWRMKEVECHFQWDPKLGNSVTDSFTMETWSFQSYRVGVTQGYKAVTNCVNIWPNRLVCDMRMKLCGDNVHSEAQWKTARDMSVFQHHDFMLLLFQQLSWASAVTWPSPWSEPCAAFSPVIAASGIAHH